MCLSRAFLLSVFVGALSTIATLPAQDEREFTTPGDALWLTNASVTTINSRISQGYRITDLEVDDAAATRFTVGMVQNTGAYRVTGWWWYFDATSSQVATLLNQNQARPIDIETYLDTGGARRYAVVMVSNTGTAAKAFSLFYASSASAISSTLANSGHRLVDVDGYTSGTSRFYAAIGIANSGADARAWWWYLGATPAQVGTLLTQNNARLVDLDPTGSGTYDIVMNRVSGGWWYYFGRTPTQVSALANQIGARVVDIERNGSTFDVVLSNNSNALTTRISAILRNGTNGVLGAFLRRLDGSNSTVLAALNADTPFEPASTMKTLVHAHAMHRVSIGSMSLSQSMLTFLGTNGSCPTGTGASVSESLVAVLSQMMELSDNNRTKTITDYFGFTSINGTANTLGMAQTSLNHVIGCGGPAENHTTLADLGRLHDRVADGWLGNEMYRFYELMVNEGSYPTAGSLNLDTLITAEAQSTGVSGNALAAFRDQVFYAAKGGNYDFPRSVVYHGSVFGMVSLPFVSSGRVVRQQYAVGTFFNDSSDSSTGFGAINTAYWELLREEVRAALRTWVGVTVGSYSAFGAGCRGSNGLVPQMNVTGAPEIGGRLTYSVTLGRAGMPAVLYFGNSSVSWNGVALPLDLGFAGAPGCSVLNNPALGVPLALDAQGAGTLQANVPLDPSLLGRSLYAQFWLADPLANALGIVNTRAIRAVIGIDLP